MKFVNATVIAVGWNRVDVAASNEAGQWVSMGPYWMEVRTDYGELIRLPAPDPLPNLNSRVVVTVAQGSF